MTTQLAPLPVQRFVDNNGNALAGGQLYTYQAGTATLIATYTDQTGGTPNTNPIILNSRGEANVWLQAGQSYKFVLYDAANNLIWSVDQIQTNNVYSQGAPVQVASAATVDIGGQSTVAVEITGNTTITGFGTNYNGPRFIRFTGTPTLTNSASLVLPTGANITVKAGDTCIAYPNYGLTGWNVVSYQRADGSALLVGSNVGTSADIASAATIDLTAVTGQIVRITGTTASSAVTMNNGQRVVCVAVAAWPLTYNATTMPVPGSANYTCSAGDIVIFTKDGSGTISVQIYKKDGTVVVTPAEIQTIGASVASNALTISAGLLALDFRSTTLGSGAVTRVTGTPANLVISNGSTLGTSNGVQSNIAVLAINNAGTIELAAVNLSGGVDLSETGLISTTAEGGAGAADSATTVYSTTARTNVAYRVIGVIRSTQTTAGTWATAPNLIQGTGGQAFAGLVALFASSNGYQKLPSGLIIQWGSVGSVGQNASTGVSFPVTFPTACLMVVGQQVDTLATNEASGWACGSQTTSGFTVNHYSSTSTPHTFGWVALGY